MDSCGVKRLLDSDDGLFDYTENEKVIDIEETEKCDNVNIDTNTSK